MGTGESFPRLRQVVLDTTDARTLAEFYRQLLGFGYRPGDEQPAPGRDDERGRDWLVLLDPAGSRSRPSPLFCRIYADKSIKIAPQPN
jgi:hypothetical protein